VEGSPISLAMGRKHRILALCGRGAATVGPAVAVLGLRECAALHGRMGVKKRCPCHGALPSGDKEPGVCGGTPRCLMLGFRAWDGHFVAGEQLLPLVLRHPMTHLVTAHRPQPLQHDALYSAGMHRHPRALRLAAIVLGSACPIPPKPVRPKSPPAGPAPQSKHAHRMSGSSDAHAIDLGPMHRGCWAVHYSTAGDAFAAYSLRRALPLPTDAFTRSVLHTPRDACLYWTPGAARQRHPSRLTAGPQPRALASLRCPTDTWGLGCTISNTLGSRGPGRGAQGVSQNGGALKLRVQ
jgi:hypothetical protein